MVGLARLELATPSLSGTYSNHLSYKPKMIQDNDIKSVKLLIQKIRKVPNKNLTG